MLITPAGNSIYDLEPYLHERILGQNEMIPRVSACLERGFLGISPHDRPKANLLFLGPTGTGKTETTILFSEFIFGPGNYFRFNMSEFMHEDTLETFIGNISGELGRLGRLLSVHEHGVILFDEMEKAHPKILDLFLQILEPGEITCGNGVTFSLKNFYMVLTSNVGSDKIVRSSRSEPETLRRAVLAELMSKFRKEFVNRFHDILIFNRLSPDVQRSIAENTLLKEIKRLSSLGYEVKSSDEALEFLCQHGMTKTLGARPMLNATIRYVGDAVRLALREGKKGGTLAVCPDRNILILG